MSIDRQPLLSVIVPVLNESAGIAATLTPLQAQRGALEVIVVDGGSEDDTRERAGPLSDAVLASARGRARQMNAGALRACGDYLLFLHADTRLPEKLDAFLQCLRSSRPAWGFFAVRLEPRSPVLALVERAMNLRSRLTRVATGDQALFVRRELFVREGGFADIPLMEDVEFSKRLRRCGRALFWRSPVVTSSRRWCSRGTLRTILLMWDLRLRYWLGASPQSLYRRYYG